MWFQSSGFSRQASGVIYSGMEFPTPPIHPSSISAMCRAIRPTAEFAESDVLASLLGMIGGERNHTVGLSRGPEFKANRRLAKASLEPGARRLKTGDRSLIEISGYHG
jgi:hypothetical protein